MIIAALIILTLLGLLTIFQLTLVFGLPFGRFAWGGQHTVLPPKLRIGSAVAVILYTIFAVLALSKSGLWVLIDDPVVTDVGLWIVTIYMALGVFVNAISRSKPERFTMTPVVLTLAVCFFVLAAG